MAVIDGTVEINAGEKRPGYVEVDAGSGNTLTILDATTTPAGANPSFELRDADGQTVASGTVTGYDSGAVQTPRVWYLIDAADLAAGVYTLEMTFETKASGEGFVRRYVRALAVWVS
ncbi:MAG TPA: hypothetical protein VFU47_03840 [Armatimonadota bacterium]|nr:hypothetical protein [Armatimonadota bacterium]